MSRVGEMRGVKNPDSAHPELVIRPSEPPLRIVLVEPKIPPNVGAVSRVNAAVGAPLFLVGDVSFQEDHPARVRAGLDYWEHVDKVYVDSLEHLREEFGGCRFHLFSTRCGRSLFDVAFAPGDFLVFGSETEGLSEAELEAHPEDGVRIPVQQGIRSLNLANAVAVAAYEAVRQIQAVQRGPR